MSLRKPNPEYLSQKIWQERVDRTIEEASREYTPSEWTACPRDCRECDVGEKYPHSRQIRVSDGVLASEYMRSLFMTQP